VPQRNAWPGYDDNDDAAQGWSIVAPEPWMQYEALTSSVRDAVQAG